EERSACFARLRIRHWQLRCHRIACPRALSRARRPKEVASVPTRSRPPRARTSTLGGRSDRTGSLVRLPDPILARAEPDPRSARGPPRMPDVNIWAVLVAALTAFLLGGMWYGASLFGNAWNREAGRGEKKPAK